MRGRNTNIAHKLRLLSSWIEDRLGEREAVNWAVKALSRVDPVLDGHTLELITYLEDQARKNKDLPDSIKNIWRLLTVAARNSDSQIDFADLMNIRGRMIDGTLGINDAAELVHFFQPRLTAQLPSPLDQEADESNRPVERWVIWRFKSGSSALDIPNGGIGAQELNKVSLDVLERIIGAGTEALISSLQIGREAGWIGPDHDLTSTRVRLVALPPDETEYSGGDDDDERDPDAFNSDFAPLVRLITTSYSLLAQRDSSAATRIAEIWRARPEHLLQRMTAYACWNNEVSDSKNVAHYLLKLPEDVFWRWSRFPEVACLRAIRWAYFPDYPRRKLERRLINGPAPEKLGGISKEIALYWRDHELARVVDNNPGDVSEQAESIVADRRKVDVEFPLSVPLLDNREPSIQFVTPAPDDLSVFTNALDEELVEVLAKALESGPFRLEDAATRFVRENPRQVIRLLAELRGEMTASSEAVWRSLLLYPSAPDAEEPELARSVTELIAATAIAMSDKSRRRIVDRLCYWLDASDEKMPDFSGAEILWNCLLEPAAEREETREDDSESDLVTSALNVPLGHLISFFLRRCPSMPRVGERPALPEKFADPLRKLRGRAQKVMAARMVTALDYFWLADEVWLKNFVIEPMTGVDQDLQLWEGFAHYAHVPSHNTWPMLEAFTYRHIIRGQLSSEALRRLAEMAIVVWVRSKQKSSRYQVDKTGFRSALSNSTDDVRASAARQFSRLLPRKDKKQVNTDEGSDQVELWLQLVRPFLDEIWPFEPVLQSPNTAKELARIPASVGLEHYPDAVRAVLPYLRPFDLWDVDSWLGLGDQTLPLVSTYPAETLALLAACVSEDQAHLIYRLGPILAQIEAADPKLARDPLMRRLRALAG